VSRDPGQQRSCLHILNDSPSFPDLEGIHLHFDILTHHTVNSEYGDDSLNPGAVAVLTASSTFIASKVWDTPDNPGILNMLSGEHQRAARICKNALTAHCALVVKQALSIEQALCEMETLRSFGGFAAGLFGEAVDAVVDGSGQEVLSTIADLEECNVIYLRTLESRIKTPYAFARKSTWALAATPLSELQAVVNYRITMENAAKQAKEMLEQCNAALTKARADFTVVEPHADWLDAMNESHRLSSLTERSQLSSRVLTQAQNRFNTLDKNLKLSTEWWSVEKPHRRALEKKTQAGFTKSPGELKEAVMEWKKARALAEDKARYVPAFVALKKAEDELIAAEGELIKAEREVEPDDPETLKKLENCRQKQQRLRVLQKNKEEELVVFKAAKERHNLTEELYLIQDEAERIESAMEKVAKVRERLQLAEEDLQAAEEYNANVTPILRWLELEAAAEQAKRQADEMWSSKAKGDGTLSLREVTEKASDLLECEERARREVAKIDPDLLGQYELSTDIMYKGVILSNPEYTLDKLGIKDNDTLTLLPSKQQISETHMYQSSDEDEEDKKFRARHVYDGGEWVDEKGLKFFVDELGFEKLSTKEILRQCQGQYVFNKERVRLREIISEETDLLESMERRRTQMKRAGQWDPDMQLVYEENRHKAIEVRGDASGALEFTRAQIIDNTFIYANGAKMRLKASAHLLTVNDSNAGTLDGFVFRIERSRDGQVSNLASFPLMRVVAGGIYSEDPEYERALPEGPTLDDIGDGRLKHNSGWQSDLNVRWDKINTGGARKEALKDHKAQFMLKSSEADAHGEDEVVLRKQKKLVSRKMKNLSSKNAALRGALGIDADEYQQFGKRL